MDENAKKDPHKGEKDRNELVINYLTLRKYIGILGISLPIILLVGSCVSNGGYLESAISEYFHTPLRQFFTISLGAMALLLFAYKGYNEVDNWVTNIAGVFGLLTAFVSTSFDEGSILRGYDLAVKHHHNIIVSLDNLKCGSFEIIPAPVSFLQSTVHLCCAALFFLSLAYMSGCQFTKAGGSKEKRLYKTCAWAIIITIVLLVPAAIPGDLQDAYTKNKLVFIGEAICMWAFGISWIAKGVYTERRITKEK